MYKSSLTSEIHQVHVRVCELQMNWARADGPSARRKALDGVPPKRFDFTPPLLPADLG